METLPEMYPLTGLQIGDIQAYGSRAFLYFAPSSHKLLILVDNRPWLLNQPSRSAKLWQLMVIKYRISPFANTRTRRKAANAEHVTKVNGCCTSGRETSKRSCRWLPVIDSMKWQENYLFPVMDLSKALHGFLVFEVAWQEVHGINYSNELQTDTSLALEVKSMKKWEFYSPDQALSCVSFWFSGSTSEIQSLKSNLMKLSVPDIDHWHDNPSLKGTLLHKTPSQEVLSDDEFLDVQGPPHGSDEHDSLELCNDQDMLHKDVRTEDGGISPVRTSGPLEENESSECRGVEVDSDITPTNYSGTLLLFRFDDSLLPFKLRQIIISEVRLLTLLESGLPSWVIFFQSYPLFCHFYRPWMRHLVRTLYVWISLVTVIIGFYDLYKNVPLLKVTASRICGPFFGWIEAWDMISRIQYLGTMLFLHNLEKGLKWFMKITRASGTLLAAILRPFSAALSEVAELLSPFLDACTETADLFLSTVSFVVESMYNVFLDLIDILVSPFELLYSYIWTMASSIYLVLCSLLRLLLVPVRCMLTLATYSLSLLSNIADLFKDTWESAHKISHLSNFSKTRQGPSEISVWRGLWNDLFSQIFGASRSIIKGLLAFFNTCNRHRLSTYNHIKAFLLRLAGFIRIAPQASSCRRQKLKIEEHHQEEDQEECDVCK